MIDSRINVGFRFLYSAMVATSHMSTSTGTLAPGVAAARSAICCACKSATAAVVVVSICCRLANAVDVLVVKILVGWLDDAEDVGV